MRALIGLFLISFSFNSWANTEYWRFQYGSQPNTGPSAFSTCDVGAKATIAEMNVNANKNAAGIPYLHEHVQTIVNKGLPIPPTAIGASCKFLYTKTRLDTGTVRNLDFDMQTLIRGTCSTNSTHNFSTNRCGLDQQKGPPPSCSSAGNPINFAIGNKFQTEVDYSTGGSSTLNFTRSYNSLDGLWRHSFSTFLRFGVEFASVVMSHGRESFFTISGTTVTPTSADLGVLSKVGTTGWQYVSTDNERFTFNTAGKLTQWSNAHGAVQQFAYAGSQVTVTDNLGNSLSFTEDADHQPLTLTAPGVQITYGYNTNKRLTSVTRVAGGQTTQRQFHYEDSRNNSWLTGITDERGVRYATWSYDDKGRATSSEHADGADKVTVAYNADGTVSVTNELGKVAKYSFQYIKGVRRITSIQGEPSANCPNSNASFTYDSNGLLKTKTDNKGVLTTYSYNSRGLEISRTEASGTAQARTITTDWHPTLFLPTVVTEPDRITRYHYDDQGRQLSRTVEAR
jgi:YD repeat-containing protein